MEIGFCLTLTHCVCFTPLHSQMPQIWAKFNSFNAKKTHPLIIGNKTFYFPQWKVHNPPSKKTVFQGETCPVRQVKRQARAIHSSLTASRSSGSGAMEEVVGRLQQMQKQLLSDFVGTTFCRDRLECPLLRSGNCPSEMVCCVC